MNIKTNMKRFILLFLICLFVLTLSTASFAGKNSSAKDDFMSFFTSAQKLSESKISNKFLSQLYQYGEANVVSRNDKLQGDKVIESREVEINTAFDAKDKFYFIEMFGAKLLFDFNKSDIYLQDSDNKLVYVCDFPDEFIDGFNNSLANESLEKIDKIQSLLRETFVRNLKSEWFSVLSSSKGVKEYRLSMNENDLIELFTSILDDLSNNDGFIDLILEKVNNRDYIQITRAELLTEIENLKSEMKISFEEYNGNIDINISLFAKKANIIDLSRVYVDFKFSDTQLKLDLKTEDNKSFYKSKKFALEALFSSKYEEYSFGGKLNDKEISFECKEIRSSRQTLLPDTQNNSFKFMIYSKDKKSFINSSEVITELTQGKKSLGKLVLKTNDRKSFLNSSSIELSTYVDDVKDDMSIRLTTIDKKTLKNTSGFKIETISDNRVNYGLSVIGNDKKALLKSSDISIKVNSNSVEIEVLSIKTNDKKSLLKTSSLHVEFNSLFDEKYTLKIDAKDKKTFLKSKNLYFLLKKDDNNYVEIETKPNSVDFDITFIKENQNRFDMIMLYLMGEEEDKPITIDRIQIKGNFSMKDYINVNNMLDRKNAKRVEFDEFQNSLDSIMDNVNM